MGDNCKFYGLNTIDHNASYSFTSANTALASYLYDNNYDTKVVSSGSDDVTPEVFIVDYAAPVTMSSIHLNSNAKNFTIDYSDDDQGSWTNFSSAISETVNASEYNFYSFTEVSGVTDLRLTMNTTQTVDAEKSVGQLRAFSLIGEVSENPSNVENPYMEDSIIHERINTYVQFSRKINMFLSFTDASVADVAIFRALKDRFSEFYVYLNGGVQTFTQEPLRPEDIFLVNYVNEFSPRLKQGWLIGAGTEIELELLGV